MTDIPALREAVAKMTEWPWRVDFHDQGCDIYGKARPARLRARP